ncbi:hypothetical protein IVB57_09500 [Bradyrhizobium sp. CW9]|uniref:tetratricopeptide repeat protein n=1 Tax=Bradyrhizobium sp. CW9 TaxID=2782689 RepID=UPI001FF8B9C1|nr:tetratricopeptide repeat protein [Bradyrhizobium sp. CW9]MCK1328625.1 hypothetical protein [Bradyrhizobium sp. CW9]
MKKNRRKPKKHRSSPPTSVQNSPSKVLEFVSGRTMRIGELGVFDRAYPPKKERELTIEAIKAVPENDRSPDQWWQLGEYLVYGGLMEESETATSEGVNVLMRGATLPEPSVACLLDLAWILSFKGLDAVALPHIERAASIVPNSRDILSLKALIHMGMGDAGSAISAYEVAVSLPGATDGDRGTLAQLKSGQDPRMLRKGTLIRKVGLEDPDLATYPSTEQALVGVHVAKQVYDLYPDDLKAAEALAYARYCAGQMDKAKPLLHSIVGAKPKNAPMWTILGLIEKKTGNPDGEVAMYQKALEADPDHVLALVNMASRIQDAGEAHKARPLLERALQVAKPDDPHLSIALDLMGNNIGALESDFLREAEFHRRAIRLAPNSAPPRVNLILALISAGRFRDAKREWQAGKHLVSRSPYPLPLGDIVLACSDDALHPYACIQLVESLSFIGKPGRAALVERAMTRRSQVPAEELLEFLQSVGLLATQFDHDDLAVKVWREAAALDATGISNINEAVALDRTGRHSEALNLIESATPAGDRYFTCLGNIRKSNGLLASAVEAYRVAVETEPLFALPYTEAFSCIDRLREPSLSSPFIARLETAWPENAAKHLLLALALLRGAKPRSACEHFRPVLFPEGKFADPEDLCVLLHDPNDLSLMAEPNADYHLDYADALVRSRNWSGLHELVSAIFELPRWANGDWRILNAEMARLSGDSKKLVELLDGMEDQVPARISLALAAIAEGNAEVAETLIGPVLANPDSSGFRHPEGHPDAVARAISSLIQRHKGDLDDAAMVGREAVNRDVGCVVARAALINALLDTGNQDDAINVVSDGLRRLPSEPRMVRLAVETMLNTGRVQEADIVLKQHRPGLAEFDADDLGFRLGEAISEAKLSQVPATPVQVKAAEAEWPWIKSLHDPIRNWLIGAYRSKTHFDEMGIALVMYVGKVTEKLIEERILIPFRNSLPDPSALADTKYRDFSGFVAGGRAPSIGGFVLFLRAASKPYRSSDPPLLVEFRNFLRALPWPEAKHLLQQPFIQSLDHLANIRNSSAHTGEPSRDEIRTAISIVVDEAMPGPIFAYLGLTT